MIDTFSAAQRALSICRIPGNRVLIVCEDEHERKMVEHGIDVVLPQVKNLHALGLRDGHLDFNNGATLAVVERTRTVECSGKEDVTFTRAKGIVVYREVGEGTCPWPAGTI